MILEFYFLKAELKNIDPWTALEVLADTTQVN